MLRGLIVLALAGATIVACLWSAPAVFQAEAGIDLNLPSLVDGFAGAEQKVSESERAILPRDTKFAKKLYTNPRGDRISCQIVLAGGEKRSIHRPEVCLPAQGWFVKGGQVTPIPLANGSDLDVMTLNIVKKIPTADGEPR